MTSVGPPQSHLKAAGWALGSGVIHQVSQVSVSLALAALLGPEAFGVVALAAIYVLFVEFLVRQGIVQAVIQKSDLTEEHTDAAFWMTLGTALVLAVATVGFAGVWADLNSAPSLRPLLIALSGVALFQALWQVPTALLQRELDFRRSEVPLNIGTACGGLAGVTAALLGAEEWAVVVQLYTYGVVGSVLLYQATPWRPRWSFSWTAARELLSVSSGALLATMGSFFSQRADSLLLGIFFGPLALGLYRLGSRFVQLIINVTSASLGRVALAVLSREQADPTAYAKALRSQLLSLNLLVFPALGILLTTGRSVALLFGEEWELAGPTLRILCLAGLARAITLFASPILQSMGKAHRAAASQWYSAVAHVAAMTVAGLLLRDSSVADQIEGVAAARVVAQLVLINPVLLRMISRTAVVPVRALLSPLVSPVVGATAGIAAGLVVDEVCLRGAVPNLVTLVAVGTTSTLVSGGVLLAVSPEARRLAERVALGLRSRRR